MRGSSLISPPCVHQGVLVFAGGGHSPCCLWSSLGVCSPWRIDTCECGRRSLCRNVTLSQRPTPGLAHDAAGRLVDMGGARVWGPCLPVVHEFRLRNSELCCPTRTPELCPLSCFPPHPLSSSLLARPACDVVCIASLPHVWFEPPSNSVFMCALTLPTLQPAGPRGGD